MTETAEGRGRCLCGAIELTMPTMARHVGACHCTLCRTWGGGPLLAVDCGTEVEIAGEEHVGIFDSSDWAQRGFCKKCGTHLFYRLKGSGKYIVPVGLLETQGELVFDHQVFVDERPAYYAFANRTEEMTGAEVFAKFAPPPEE